MARCRVVLVPSHVMTRISQIIAVEKGVKAEAARCRGEAERDFTRTPQLSGIARTYQPRDEDGDTLPPESTNVQIKAEESLAAAAKAYARLFDVTLTKDEANTQTGANVEVDGEVLIMTAPVTWLLFAEKQCAELHALISRLPVLDPAETWERDGVSGNWKTAPVKTVRSKKIPRNHVVAEATKEHPAQVQVYTEDVPAGDWTTIKFSGAVPATRKATLLARISALQEAIHVAREEANTYELHDRKIGEDLFAWLLAE